MQDRYYSDEICQVKRYKGRKKYEIFIHNKEFREKLKDLNIHVFKEDLHEARVIEKKILSPSVAYARYLQACYLYIWTQVKMGKQPEAIQEYLNYLVDDSTDSQKLNEISDDEKYASALEKTYQLIRSRIHSK